MAKRVITFGEIMMRLNPIGYLRLVQSDLAWQQEPWA